MLVSASKLLGGFKKMALEEGNTLKIVLHNQLNYRSKGIKQDSQGN
jgi:hypothetical protein